MATWTKTTSPGSGEVVRHLIEKLSFSSDLHLRLYGPHPGNVVMNLPSDQRDILSQLKSDDLQAVHFHYWFLRPEMPVTRVRQSCYKFL